MSITKMKTATPTPAKISVRQGVTHFAWNQTDVRPRVFKFFGDGIPCIKFLWGSLNLSSGTTAIFLQPQSTQVVNFQICIGGLFKNVQ